jgi:hypothetical protein
MGTYTYIYVYIYIYLAMCETICNIHIYNFFFLLKGGKPIYAQLCLGSRRLIADIKYQAISTKHYNISKLGNGTGTANPNRQRTELCRLATQIQILRAGIACDPEPVTNRNRHEPEPAPNRNRHEPDPSENRNRQEREPWYIYIYIKMSGWHWHGTARKARSAPARHGTV